MLDGLDETLTGMEKGATATFSTTLVGGDRKGEEVDVTVVLQDVKEQHLPDLDEDFAQMASEFDTVEELRADLSERVTRGKRMEQAAEARDLVLEQIVDADRRTAARDPRHRGDRQPPPADRAAARPDRPDLRGLPRRRGADRRRVRGRAGEARPRLAGRPVRARPGRGHRGVRHRRQRAEPAHHAPRPAVRRGPQLLHPAHHGAQPRARDGQRGPARQGARLAGRGSPGHRRVRCHHRPVEAAGRRHHRRRQRRPAEASEEQL